MITRRNLVTVCGGALALFALPLKLVAAKASSIKQAIDSSDLIYLTAIRSDGNESSCQSEVWFVPRGSDLYVVTATSSWRVRALKKGLNKARIWVGDLGPWQGTEGKYKDLPILDAMAAEVTDATEQEQILDKFGSKYTAGWIFYGSRFRDGLADGSRTMVRYRPMPS
jgi:hypothetical protein